jgi:hypothetical protein
MLSSEMRVAKEMTVEISAQTFEAQGYINKITN